MLMTALQLCSCVWIYLNQCLCRQVYFWERTREKPCLNKKKKKSVYVWTQTQSEVSRVREKKASSVSTGGQRCHSQIQPSTFFFSKEPSVTQEFRLCFYSLSYYVSGHLRHPVLSLSLFATLKQKQNLVQLRGEAKSALLLTPLTCSLWHWSAVSCACVVFKCSFHMISLFFYYLNGSSGILLKNEALCNTAGISAALQDH